MTDSPFIAGTSIQWAWDATSLGLLKECDYKYWLKIVNGWRPKGEGLHVRFGQIFHTAAEHYDKYMFQGMSHDDAQDAVVQEAMVSSHPWPFTDPNKTRENLIRSIIWYTEGARSDGSETIALANGQPAVELSFRFSIDAHASDGTQFILCGHLDRICRLAGEIYIIDYKTTTSTPGQYYFDKYSPDNQMSLYTLAGNVVYQLPVRGVVINAVQIAIGFTRFERGTAYRTMGQLDEWLSDAVYWMHRAEANAVRGHWPKNDKSCNAFGGCEFRMLCNKDPQVRESFLKTHFTNEHKWNPLEVR